LTGPALKFARLQGTGRLLVEAIGSLGTAPANTYKRWANAWRLVLAGRDTPQSRAVLAGEARKLKKYLESLPEKERYEAAMAIHMRVPRSVADDPLLAKLAKETSTLLEPGMEKLVGEVARALHHEIGHLMGSLVTGKALSAQAKTTLKYVQAFKAVTGDKYDEAVEELARETVRQLKATPKGPVKRIGSKVNSVQGAVAQAAFFRAKQFRNKLRDTLRETVPLVKKLLGSKWTTSTITEGRIYLATKTKSGFTIDEFVDGAVVVHESAARAGRLPRGFPRLTAQVKAELDISALPQNLQDELRRTPNWGSEDAIMLIPSGKSYRALQVVPPPEGLGVERLLIAAEGGTWPKDLTNLMIPSVYQTLKAEGPLTRDACRAISKFALSKASAALKAASAP